MATQGYQEYQNYQNHQSSPNHTHSQQGGGSQQQVPPSMQQHYDPYGMNVENYYQVSSRNRSFPFFLKNFNSKDQRFLYSLKVIFGFKMEF